MSATAWLWFLLIVEIGIIDGILTLLHQPTLSQWLWGQHKRHRWSRWLLLGTLVVITIHLVWAWLGGPSTPTPAPTPPVDPQPICEHEHA